MLNKKVPLLVLVSLLLSACQTVDVFADHSVQNKISLEKYRENKSLCNTQITNNTQKQSCESDAIVSYAEMLKKQRVISNYCHVYISPKDNKKLLCLNTEIAKELRNHKMYSNELIFKLNQSGYCPIKTIDEMGMISVGSYTCSQI